MTHQFPIRVYFEDTDLAGIVYYANYLKFIERGRTELVRELGVDQVALQQEQGIVFAVRRVEADYFAPAVFDDELIVETTLESLGGASIAARQEVKRDGKTLFSALVTLVAIDARGQAVRIPANIRQLLQGAQAKNG